LNIFSDNGRENNLSIQSEEDGAPAPWAKTTTGEDDDLSFVPSLLVLRLLFVGGEESIICVQEIKIQCSEIFPLFETLKIRIVHRKLIYFTLVAGEISAQQSADTSSRHLLVVSDVSSMTVSDVSSIY
jgi:hypothetical protein